MRALCTRSNRWFSHRQVPKVDFPPRATGQVYRRACLGKIDRFSQILHTYRFGTPRGARPGPPARVGAWLRPGQFRFRTQDIGESPTKRYRGHRSRTPARAGGQHLIPPAVGLTSSTHGGLLLPRLGLTLCDDPAGLTPARTQISCAASSDLHRIDGCAALFFESSV